MFDENDNGSSPCMNCEVFNKKPIDANICDRYCKYKYEYIIKEEKSMIITIIGSLSNIHEMEVMKEYFERFGHKVNCPGDPELQKKSLFEIQSDYIAKIEQSDLIIAVPKNIMLEGDGGQKIAFEFGESTTYEMAIAYKFHKKVIFA